MSNIEIDSARQRESNDAMLPRCARNAIAFIPAVLLTSLACEQPNRPAVTYPPDTLAVRYEPATRHTTCLVASVAMAANYLLGERKFTEESLLRDLKAAGRDESSIDDLKSYLEPKGLYLLTLSGTMDGKPPSSMRYWLQKRGYPVVCIINTHGDDAAFNHAVVVTGIRAGQGEGLVDKVVYLDPAASQPLQTETADWFDTLWARGQHAMMIVVAPPSDSQPSATTPRESR